MKKPPCAFDCQIEGTDLAKSPFEACKRCGHSLGSHVIPRGACSACEVLSSVQDVLHQIKIKEKKDAR